METTTVVNADIKALVYKVYCYDSDYYSSVEVILGKAVTIEEIAVIVNDIRDDEDNRFCCYKLYIGRLDKHGLKAKERKAINSLLIQT